MTRHGPVRKRLESELDALAQRGERSKYASIYHEYINSVREELDEIDSRDRDTTVTLPSDLQGRMDRRSGKVQFPTHRPHVAPPQIPDYIFEMDDEEEEILARELGEEEAEPQQVSGWWYFAVFVLALLFVLAVATVSVVVNAP